MLELFLLYLFDPFLFPARQNVLFSQLTDIIIIGHQSSWHALNLLSLPSIVLIRALSLLLEQLFSGSGQAHKLIRLVSLGYWDLFYLKDIVIDWL